ncbi:MAG: hypothetical protein ACFFFO_17690 [Candidatus Thorarchaeota archaeon]
MRLIDRLYPCHSRSDTFTIYPLGDLHIGARNCAEKPLRKLLKQIEGEDNAIIIGGGDWLDLIRPQDLKRFDFDTLPDWLIEGDAMTTREAMGDIVQQQVDRVVEMFYPLAKQGKVLGILAGNHEFSVKKFMGLDVQKALCRKLGVEDLTDEALIRLRFKQCSTTQTVILYCRHGYGGGRTPGAEPNKLDRMLNEWEIADVCMTGHTHTPDELPPKPVLEIPRKGKLPPETFCRYRYAFNWGCWVYSHAAGPSSYTSRGCFPARPLLTYKVVVKPISMARIMRNGKNFESQCAKIEIRKIPIS